MRTVPRASGIEAIHPLTPLQEGILFHSLAAPDAGLYLVQPVFELDGELDPALLRRAAAALVARHAALRTAFVWQGQDRPRQVVHRHVETPWEERDLRGAPAEAALAGFLEEDGRRGLDPARAPLCRFALLRAGERRHWLVVTHHHLVLDGWSMPIVTRELASVYAALRGGAAPDLPPARPFGEYAAWLARRSPDADAAYWRDALRGFRAPTPLVVDTVARAAEGGRPLTGRSRVALEGAPAARLREFGRRQKLAFATLAQAAWALYLSRCSGERDVLFGVVTSGRSAELEGVEGIVGMFVNSLPVRVRVPRRAPLLPWLRELQAGLAGLREHEHCSLTQVQGWSELPPGAPLFESLLAVQTLGPISPELRIEGLAIRPLAGEERVGLPLTVVAYPAPGDGVWMGVEHDRRRIPPEAAAPLLDQYGRLLTGLAAASDVDEVELLPRPPLRPGRSTDAMGGLAAALGLGAGDRVLVAAAPGSPEALLREGLRAAGMTVLPAEDAAAATAAIGPPGAWEAWARARPDLGRLLAVVSGEAPPPALVAELSRRCRGLRTLALEAGCVGDPLRHAGLGGSPPPGLAVHLLDAELRPLPAGATGEVWLAGGRLDAGADSLRPDPLGDAGALMTRTGWRGRRRHDGDLELLGPIERGAEGARPAVSAAEVEALLAGHPAVGRAVVAGGDAYAVLAPGEAASAADLRAHLRRHLPAHVVPPAIRVVERLPLDAGGRVDRSRLGAPAPSPGPAEGPDDLLHRLAQAPPERRARFLARLRAELTAAGGDTPAADSRQQLHGWLALEPRPGPEGAGAGMELPAALVAGLERVAAGAGADLRAVLLAGYAELLHRWSGQAAVLVGTGTDLVLRVDAGGRPSLAELTGRAARALADAGGRREAPRPGDGVRVTIGADGGLFEPATVERMAGILRHLLQTAADAPDHPLADLPLLDSEQRRRLLAWAAGAAAEPSGEGIGERFATRAAKHPDAVAVVHAGRPATYGVLARRTSRIAHAVRRRGLGPEDRVAILLERGADMVAAVLGVLTAGAACVPLDPAHPPARTAFILADAGARLALTQRALSRRLEGCPVLELDGDALDGLPDVPPAPLSGLEHLAYVLYTSGSTGRPKGVLVEQRSVVGFASQIAAAYEVDEETRMLALAPLTFDLSVFEIFTALLSGASLHVASEQDRLQPERLQRLLREERITVAELPPALMPMLDPDGLPDLRLVSVGGEAFTGELVGRWWRPGRRFVNGYGPTETTVAVTLKDCEGTWERMPPIGRAMPGHQAHVLDEGLRPLPVGMPGELCVGGVGLARGYQGRPDLTADRFVPDPFGEPGRRLYRTGDRACWLPSGEIQLLGRLDRQVKVRGHRVEPGEVEAAIARIEGVRQVAVEAVPDEAGRLQLAAYVAGEWRPDLPALRARLEAELPAYLLPSRVVHLDRLPLTARGKVDRGALPPPAIDPVEAAAPPGTWIEERIAGDVVGPLLQLGEVDVERDFFELGGNSLEAIQVVSRVAEAFEVEVDLGEFLAEPTVRRLGQLVEAALATGAEAGDPLAQIMEEVEALSEEEAERLLRRMEEGGG